jgi:peroxiredoxin
MKNIVALVMSVCFFATIYAQDIQSVNVGSNISKLDVKMKDVSGNPVSIYDAMGNRGVLVIFSCNTCPYVIKNEERILQAVAYAQQNSLGVIIINSNEDKRNSDDSFEAMQAYAKKQSYNCYYVVDSKSEMANVFGATRTPEVFILSKEGTVVYKGALDDSPADAKKVTKLYVQQAIDEIVANKPITNTATKSIGCSIKRKS